MPLRQGPLAPGDTMRSSIRPIRARCFACSLVFVSLGALAEEPPSNYASEYMKRLKAYQTVQPHGDKPFGEQINLYTGELSFSHTDIVLEGTGPTIRVVRTRSGTGFDEAAEELHPASMFVDWTLQLPRIDTLVADPRNADGTPGGNWRMGPAADAESFKRCSNFGSPYAGQSGIVQEDWWHGYEITLADGSPEPLLRRNPAYAIKPAMAGAFPALTMSNAQLTCLASTKNDQPGEGFLAIAPDGTKYWFDWLVGSKANAVFQTVTAANLSVTTETAGRQTPAEEAGSDEVAEKLIPGGGAVRLQQDRMQVSMFVTRVEDRFGNALTYDYSGSQLRSITATDGRVVTFAWSGGRIASITVMPNTPDARTWQYQYPNGKLGAVVLPDQSRWTFHLGAIGGSDTAAHPSGANSCSLRSDPNTPGPDSTSTISTVTAPSGLTGTFAIQKRWHGRSYTGSYCDSGVSGSHEMVPPIYSTRSLYKRTLSGPGISAMTWTYLYSPAAASTLRDACAADNSCASTAWIDVVEPSGDRTRYTSSTRYDALEGKVVSTETYAANGTLLRTVGETYTAPTTAALPYLPRVGYADLGYRVNENKLENRTPLRSRVIRQQDRDFRWIVPGYCGSGTSLCFDAFARPTGIVKQSMPSP